jgi:hypothetical protein
MYPMIKSQYDAAQDAHRQQQRRARLGHHHAEAPTAQA